MSDKTKLGKRMIDRAIADKLPSDHALYIKGREFEAACNGYLSTPQTVSVKCFLGAWARARKVWCDYTGESLI